MSPHAVQARHVHITRNKDKMLFVLFTSKTHTCGDKPQMIKITSTPVKICKQLTNSIMQQQCPLQLLKMYLKCRLPAKSLTEQFFVFSDNSAVKPHHMREILHMALSKINLNSSLYGTHSLRIGRSSDLLRYGVSVETIKKLGRWKSNAIFKYLRA